MTGYPSIDKPWMKYYTYEITPAAKCTIWRNIYDANKDYPNDIALVYYGRKITYKELFHNIETAKKAFIAAGVRRGENVSFLMLSCPEMLYAILALNQLGVVANMVNPTFTPEQMRDRINDSEANIILILDQLYERLAPVMDEICPAVKVIVPIENSMPLLTRAIAHRKLKKKIPYSGNTVTWNAFVKAAAFDVPDVADCYVPETPAIMVYSSGSTGASKGIVLTNDGINSTISHYISPDFPFSRGDSFLHMGAPWLSTLMVFCLLMPLRMGMKVIVEPVFSEKTFAAGIIKYKPQLTLSTVSHWLYFINSPKAAKLDMSFFNYPCTGGEKVLPKTEKAINTFFAEHNSNARLLIGYGMCELGSTVVSNSLKYYKTGSAGYPITGVTVSAFDPITEHEMPCGQRGEIRVDSPNRMKEYYKRPDATSEFFHKAPDGTVWGCTGDVGYVDEDGFVFVQGRATDTYRLPDGKPHYCFDIEDIILNLDGIDQCEIVAVPNETGYDDLHCFVVKESGVQDADLLSRLREYCQSKVPSESMPKSFRILDKFPIKPSGKRDMETLKKMAAEQ